MRSCGRDGSDPGKNRKVIDQMIDITSAEVISYAIVLSDLTESEEVSESAFYEVNRRRSSERVGIGKVSGH